jgi:hypothetical protein
MSFFQIIKSASNSQIYGSFSLSQISVRGIDLQLFYDFSNWILELLIQCGIF